MDLRCCPRSLWTQQLSNSAERSRALWDLSLNRGGKTEEAGKMEQLLIVCTSIVADKIRPHIPKQRLASSSSLTRHGTGQRGQWKDAGLRLWRKNRILMNVRKVKDGNRENGIKCIPLTHLLSVRLIYLSYLFD